MVEYWDFYKDKYETNHMFYRSRQGGNEVFLCVHIYAKNMEPISCKGNNERAYFL